MKVQKRAAPCGNPQGTACFFSCVKRKEEEMKIKVKKRILSLMMAVCLISAMMPTVTFAEGTGTVKAIQLVDGGNPTGGISGYDSTKCYDYIYFGNWKAQDTHTSSGPIKWRVLDTKTNMEEAEEGDGLFLLSDALLGTGSMGGVYFKQDGTSNAWQGSDAQTWCETLYKYSFSNGEQNAVLATTKSDKKFDSSSGPEMEFECSQNILSEDKVFFLSAEEAENSAYGFTDNNARIANYGNGAGVWWLRSPNANYTYYAGAVDITGSVSDGYVDSAWAARPALNLNLNSVIFTSAAEGGKSADTLGTLTSVSDYNGSEWKLTLLDNSRNFTANVNGQNSVSVGAGCSIEVSYSGAQTGSNEYVSALLCDSNGNVLYYGNIAQNDESGTATLTLPSGLITAGSKSGRERERCRAAFVVLSYIAKGRYPDRYLYRYR